MSSIRNLPLPLPLLSPHIQLNLGDPATQLVEHCKKHLYDLFQDCLSSYNRNVSTATPRDQEVQARRGLQSRTVRDLEKAGTVFLRELAVSSAIFWAMLSPERSKWSLVEVFFVNDSMRSCDQVTNSNAR